MKRTLLLIFAALALMIGSFIWFVATWDRNVEQPVSWAPSSSWNEKLPPEGPLASSAHPAVEQYQTHTGPIPNPYGVL